MSEESNRPAQGRPGVIGAAWGLPGGGTVLAFDGKRVGTQLYCITARPSCQVEGGPCWTLR